MHKRRKVTLNAYDRALFQAITNQHIIRVHWAVNNGANVNVVNDFGRTPLHCALQGQLIAIVQYLLDKGANPNIKDNLGISPIMLAAAADDRMLTALLKDRTVNVNDKNHQGMTPLDQAVQQGAIKNTELLLARGAKVNACYSEGKTPMHRAAKLAESDILIMLLQQPEADVNVVDDYGNTPLHSAVAVNSIKNMALLLAYGANVNAKGYDYQTVLFLAVTHNNHHIVNLLLKQPGIDVNIANLNGVTPLNWALAKEQMTIINVLIDYGATINITTNQERNVIDSILTKQNYKNNNKISKVLIAACYQDFQKNISPSIAEIIDLTKPWPEIKSMKKVDTLTKGRNFKKAKSQLKQNLAKLGIAVAENKIAKFVSDSFNNEQDSLNEESLLDETPSAHKNQMTQLVISDGNLEQELNFS